MTERKPRGVSFESWVDKQVREAEERGDFDDLPGTGKPLPGSGGPLEEMWWIKQKMRSEGLTTEALLPTSLRLRKEIQRLPEKVRELRSERSVREAVTALNLEVVAYLRAPSEPRIPLGPVDVDDVIARWRAGREESGASETPRAVAEPAALPWWRRFTRAQRGAR